MIISYEQGVWCLIMCHNKIYHIQLYMNRLGFIRVLFFLNTMGLAHNCETFRLGKNNLTPKYFLQSQIKSYDDHDFVLVKFFLLNTIATYFTKCFWILLYICRSRDLGAVVIFWAVEILVNSRDLGEQSRCFEQSRSWWAAESWEQLPRACCKRWSGDEVQFWCNRCIKTCLLTESRRDF